MERAPSQLRWPVGERVLDGAVVLAAAGLAWVLPLFLPGGPSGAGPLPGTLGFMIVAVLMRASLRRPLQDRMLLAGAAAAGVAAWALLAPGQAATADDPTNLLMSLAPVLPQYAGHLYAQDRRRAWTLAAVLTAVAAHPWSTSTPAVTSGLLYVCTPMLFGFYLGARQLLVRTLTDRAESAERERDLLAERARTQERMRLAVELHDIVTHRVSLMVLHAGALRMTAAGTAVRDAAENVRATGCEALAELRELIGVLRNVQPPPAATAERCGGEPVDEPAGRPPVDRSDVRVAVAAVAWTVLLTTYVASWPPSTGVVAWTFPWLTIALQLPAAAVFVLHRRHPHLVIAVTIADSLLLLGLAASGFAAAGMEGGLATGESTALLVPAVAPLAAYTVAARSRRPVAGTALVLGLIAVAARPWAPHVAVVSVAAAFLGVPALLGLYVGAWRRLVAALTERAERAEREQWLLAGRARAEERARLAGEMHEIVAGRVRRMLGWSDRLAGAAASEETRAAAGELIASGRQALDELHHLVGALRTSPSLSVPTDPTGDADSTGDAGPAALARLAAESASVGVPVDLVEEGDPAVPSPAVLRTAHRIAREALTNVRKHAHGAHVQVRVRYGADQVRVEVRNGRPPGGAARRGDHGLAAGGSGTGLLGVRQRVELVDGTLEAGPTAEGGFVVDAILPSYVPTRPLEEPSR